MASGPAHFISRWPHPPFWELEGFDFTGSQSIKDYRPNGLASGLHKREYTSVASSFPPRRPTAAECTVLVCNNVAVHFRAMMYCRDSATSNLFWDRVSHCALNQGKWLAEGVGRIFVEARRAYLHRYGVRDCPNGAVKAVDDWIDYLDSDQRMRAPEINAPWQIRFAEWVRMKSRGDLLDAGYRTHQVREMRGTPASQAPSPSLGAVSAFATPEYHPISPGIKRESASPALEEHSPNFEIERGSSQEQADSGTAELDTANPTNNSPRRKRKRARSETPATSDPGSAQCRTKRVARAASRSPSVEFVRELSVPPKRNTGHRSTKFRVTDCEEKLADHINLVHAQDSKLSALEKLVAKQATKIEKLSARVKSVEKKVPEAGDIETMQHSIAELTDRVNNRSTYIRTEIKKQWNDVRTPYEQEQARVNTRLDSFRDDLAVQKVRVEDCQKAVDEHIKKRKDHGIELSALEETVRKKSRIRRRQIEKLSDRVSELEGKLSGRQPVAADPDDEDTDEEDAPQMEARLASLTERIAELERKQELHRQEQETAIDNIWKRLNKVENSHANLKKTSKANHAALEEQAKDHETRLTRQKRGTSSRNNQLANVGLQVRNSARGHWSAAPSGSYIRFTD